MMEEKPGNHQLIARDLIPMMQLNLEHTPKTNQRMKVTFQQQCYRLVPDLLLSPPSSAGDRPSEINKPHTPPLKHSTPVVNIDDVVEHQRPKRRQLPQIPADKKPFEKLWQIGMSRLESNNNNNNKNFEQNLERQNLRRWKLTRANMVLEIKTDPTTGQTVSINIVDDDDEIDNHKENVRLSFTSSLLSNVGENPPPPPTSLDWSLADQTPPSSSSMDYTNGGTDSAEIMMMIQTPTTLQCSSTQQSSSSSPKPKQRPTTSSAKDSSDSGISTSSLDSPSVTLNDHTSEITSEQEQQQTESPPEPTHRALFKFCARHPDEINLQIGDLVHIYQEFDDQWSEGLNLATGCRGIFPTALVIDLNYSEFVFENEPPPTTTTTVTNVNNNDNSWIDFRIQRERFQLDFLGSIEVFKAKGEDVLDESIRRVAIGVGDATTTMKLGMKIPYHCWLEVSDIGIRMSDGHGNSSEIHGQTMARKSSTKQQQQQDYFFALVQITYCGYQFKNNDNLYYFAFITRHPTVQQRFACHVFQSFDTSTRTVAEAVGRAFHRFYNRFVQITLPNSMDSNINSTTNKIIP